MAQLEYGDYYKFIASAGIALIAGAVIVPWMFLREPFDLAIEASKIALLTPDAQNIVHARQHLIATTISYLPLASGVSVRGSPRLTFSQNLSVETEVMAFRPIRLTPSDAYFLASFLKTIERTQAGFTPFGRGFDRGMHFHIWLDADSLEF